MCKGDDLHNLDVYIDVASVQSISQTLYCQNLNQSTSKEFDGLETSPQYASTVRIHMLRINFPAMQ